MKNENLKWENCDGRKAKTVWFPATPDAQLQLNNVESELICVVEYMGDRSDVWICEVRDGKELSRHNAKTIESIIWEISGN
jgi:hypothetical protein